MNIKRLVALTLALTGILAMLASCKGGSSKPLLPNVSGKAGEVIVVMNKDDWDGNLGAATRDLLASDYPFLPQREPLSLWSMSLWPDLLTCSRFIEIYLYII